uniref:C-type lectin domain-containing protein n=1 Tax=Cyprinus carpio TaxID=7962 RepID=A0A8C2BZR6_CYPCA
MWFSFDYLDLHYAYKYYVPFLTFPCFSVASTKYILIEENKSWREHHVDLVSIHSDELQNRTARKATQASTSHVWLGLRYTCTFDFWFWIKNREAGCYKNWAPGHGPHGYEDCGLSGAMESTGGYRWVGRPESERLNFICQLCTDVF